MNISPLPPKTSSQLLLTSGRPQLLLEAGKQRIPTSAKVGVLVVGFFGLFARHLSSIKGNNFPQLSQQQQAAYIQAYGPEK